MANSTRVVSLEWHGPRDGYDDLPAEPGLYAITGRMYGSSEIRLLYVGVAKNGLKQRWTCGLHRDWLRRSVEALGAKLWFTKADDSINGVILDVERILIHVQQPHQNSSGINSKLPSQRYILHNVGSIPPDMLPVIDTSYPWFKVVNENEVVS